MSVTLNTKALQIKDPNTGEYVNVATYGASGEVAEWLADHPEATTTVQDKSITPAKFADSTVTYIEQVTDRHTAEEIASSVETETAKQVAQMQVKEGQTVVDATLTVAGAAADAKKTGDEVAELKNDIHSYNYIDTVTCTKSNATGVNVFVLDNPIPANFEISITNDTTDSTYKIILIDVDRGVHNLGPSTPGSTRTATINKSVVEFRAEMIEGTNINSALTYGNNLLDRMSEVEDRVDLALDGVSVRYTQTGASGIIVKVLDIPVPVGMEIRITNDSDDTTFAVNLIDEDRGSHNLGASAPGYTRITTQTKPIVEVRYSITDGSTLDSTVTYGEHLISKVENMEDSVSATEVGLQALESTISHTYQKSPASGVIVYVLDVSIPNGTELTFVNNNDTTFKITLIDKDRNVYNLGNSIAYYVRKYTTLAEIVEVRFEILSGTNLNVTMSYGADIVERVSDIEKGMDGTLKTRNTAVLGYALPDDLSDYTGVTEDYALAMRSAVTSWMSEYAGNDNKVPFIVHTDQHGRLTKLRKGIFQLLDYIVNWDDVSAIFNLGDTIIDHWEDDDTNTNPLLRNRELENALNCIQPIPLDKQINVYGNHDTWYMNGTVATDVTGTLPSKCYLNPYFKSRGLRTVKHPDNSGLMVVYDDRYKIKYLVIASWDYASAPLADQTYMHYFASVDHWKWMIKQMATDEGYTLVIVSHLPLIIRSGSAFDPITQEALTGTTYYFASGNQYSPLVFAARKDKTSGSITINGEEISYDFTGCTDDCICSIAGHTHYDMIDRAGGTLLVSAFDWFDNDTIHFGLFDLDARKLKVWKLSNDNSTPAVQNWETPFDI